MRDLRNKSVAGPMADSLTIENSPGATLQSNQVSPEKGRLPEPALDAKT